MERKFTLTSKPAAFKKMYDDLRDGERVVCFRLNSATDAAAFF